MTMFPISFTLRATAAAILVASAQVAYAVTPFPVTDIRLEGLQRVEPGTIFASLPFKVGDTYNDDKGAAAIRALFALGLFKDVRVDVSGSVVVVIVEERPSIASVDFDGVKEFDKDTLKKALRDIGLSDGRPYDKSVADRAEQELKRQYIGRSLYAADVKTTITPTERNRVNVTFSVVEGDFARIRSINIVGNQAFSESTLKDLFDLDTGGWLSWYTKSDRYSRTKFSADLESLRSYYLNRGYLEFRIDSTQVALTPDKQAVNLTINISEGARFVVSEVKLNGSFFGKDEEFKSFIKIAPGQAYNADLVNQTVKAFTELYGSYGYAFAQVKPVTDIDRANSRVSVTLDAQPDRRAYVRKVNIAGNARTRDEVIRRELRQLEAAWYDGDKIRLSRDRVDRLGYFKDVAMDTQEVPGAPDQVDLLLNVAEKPTGALSIGAGFSSSEKLSLSFSVSQENVFGSGNYLGLNVALSKYNRTIGISTTDPYFTPDGVSRTIDITEKNTKPLTTEGGDYTLATRGFGMRFGVPFSEVDRVFFGVGYERMSLSNGANLPASYAQYFQTYGETTTSIPFTLSWARDERDSALAPTRGTARNAYGEWGVLGDVKYLRAGYTHQVYIPLTKQYTIGLNGDVGIGKAMSDKTYPIFKTYRVGGLGSVRGFEAGTLGPLDSTGYYLGGTRKIVANAELITPLPGAGNDKTVRAFGFVDAGNAYGENEKVNLSLIRASAGFGVRWVSPMGPLSLAWARPIRKQPADRITNIQIQIGNSF
jgi:outer membrane protein insertion porin family